MTHTKRLAVLVAASAVAAGLAPTSGPAMGPTNPLVGSWQRTNSCTAFVKAMRRAGLGHGLSQWPVGAGYFRSARQIDPARPCKHARNVKHSHFFTAAGGFGSRDEKGNQVDDGDYEIIAPHTLAFPSHAREFGHKVKIHYRITAGGLRFHVVVPHPCTGRCRDVMGWALSAFYAGPAFTRGH
jgi:hypothetical protein